MKAERELKLGFRMREAIAEVEELIKRKYPEATFRTERSPENPRIIHLIPIVDVEDTDEVMDVVVDRVGEMQIEEHLPLFVVPLRTEARNAAIRAAMKQRGAAPHQPLPPE